MNVAELVTLSHFPGALRAPGLLSILSQMSTESLSHQRERGGFWPNSLPRSLGHPSGGPVSAHSPSVLGAPRGSWTSWTRPWWPHPGQGTLGLQAFPSPLAQVLLPRLTHRGKSVRTLPSPQPESGPASCPKVLALQCVHGEEL